MGKILEFRNEQKDLDVGTFAAETHDISSSTSTNLSGCFWLFGDCGRNRVRVLPRILNFPDFCLPNIQTYPKIAD